ncbi:von Willebrand factor type A domain-containing protein [Xylaria sp. FL1042]|nr:von Willebrand factor type A domain-containing protein [Xylaria sp. FL1042]
MFNTSSKAPLSLFGSHCGCWYYLPADRTNPFHQVRRAYLPLHGMKAHTIIKDVASRTVLTQTFSNDTEQHLKNIAYSFPLYDGVSVASFTATFGDVQIQGIVKEKQQARREYHDAVSKGSSAGLLEQLPEASDIFVTNIGNVPARTRVIVEVIYIGELKHDAESNGIRFTIPSSIAPRYGTTPNDITTPAAMSNSTNAIQVIVDFESPEGCPIQQIQSPSHPITVSIGRTSNMPTTTHMTNRGSATLSLDSTTIGNDFVVMASIKDADIPRALIETHPTISNQRALMATLVPRFNLAPAYSEIVFIVDRSSSMKDEIAMVIKAMTILLKSLPVGTKFNICSFGSHHSFLWPRSKSYNDESLNEALNHIDTFSSNYGGTEMYQPVEAAISRRFSDITFDAIILTDGQIWDQENLFSMIEKASTDYKCRFFSLGIGSGASTSLVEGIATAGNGLSQFVTEGEKMDKKMVRLLKGALTPHIDDYNLEVKYKNNDDDYEIIESVKAAPKIDITVPQANRDENAQTPISFFDNKLDADSDGDVIMMSTEADGNRFAHLPVISPPSILQAPCRVPPLYRFSRRTVYILLDPSTYHKTPEAIILRATSPQGPLELEVKVEDIGNGETIHQLAAKRAMSELEKSGGWLATATDKSDGALIKKKYDSRWEEIVEREAVRLGVKYQIASKWCSFVAVEGEVEHEAIVFGEKKKPYPSTSMFNSFTRSKNGPQMFGNVGSTPTAFGQTNSSNKSSWFGSASFSKQAGSASNVALFGSANSSQNTGSASSTPMFGSTNFGDRGGSASGVSIFGSASTGKNAWSAPGVSLFGSTSSSTNLGSKPSLFSSARASTQPGPTSDVSPFDSVSSKGAFGLTPSPGVRSHGDKMHEIIRLQKSDGSWEWDQRLLDILEIRSSPEIRNAVVATALAIAFLEKRMGHEVDSWELIVEKARNWLGRQHHIDAEKEISDAEKLLGSENT